MVGREAQGDQDGQKTGGRTWSAVGEWWRPWSEVGGGVEGAAEREEGPGGGGPGADRGG